MPSGYHEIPVLPVIVPLGAVVFAVLLWRLHRRAALTVPRVVVSAVASVYVAGVVGNTLLPIFFGKSSDLAWWEWPNLTPVVGYEARDLLANVVVFIPLGVLLPLVARVRSVRGVLLAGFLISLTIELLQWVNDVTADGGHVPDVNDLLSNTLGTPIGYGIFRVALLVPALSRWARAASWPLPLRDEPTIQPAGVTV